MSGVRIKDQHPWVLADIVSRTWQCARCDERYIGNKPPETQCVPSSTEDEEHEDDAVEDAPYRWDQ